MSDQKTIAVLAVGDVWVNRDDPDSIFKHVTHVIKSADIAFCQLETNYSERGTPLPQARVPMRAHPRNAPAIRNAGFNVVSFASNHHYDYGSEALLDTIEVMRKTGIELIGVGKNIAEARKPQIVNCKGTQIGFLAYSSILPLGYWAEANKPGCAPIRGFTLYEQVEHDQPGTPARIHSFAHESDKAAMIEDIERLKAQVDIVMVSMHWGIHFKEAEIAMYQKKVGYAALDAGADVILGHHAHILKAIEIYKGKPIFYSLCNFACDHELPQELLSSQRWKELMELNPSWTLDPRYKSYPFPADARMTMAVKIIISDKKIKKISFLPALINEDSSPRFLSPEDKEFNDVVKYMEKITKSQNIDTKYTVEGDEVIIGT
ncbi:MAG: CapA family protein [Thermodesulfobacteriota bacterium]|nr:CapA family protein [Thermodesulfobacteriota bacterium]